MKKPAGEVYISVLFSEKKKARDIRGMMAQRLVELYGKDSLKHVMVGCPLERAVLSEMYSRNLIQHIERTQDVRSQV